MSTKTLPPENREEQDKRFNPGQENWDKFVDAHYSPQEKEKLNDIANQERSTQAPNQAKEAASSRALAEKESWKTDFSPSNEKPKGSIKKKSAITAAITGGVLALILGIASITPFGMFIHLKEVASSWADKFNRTAYHQRIKQVQKTRYFHNKTCTGIKCKILPKRIPAKEIDKLKAAGLEPVTNDQGKITHFNFKENGKVTRVDAGNFDSFYDNNPKFLAALSKATAPSRAITWRSGQALKKFSAFGIDRSKIPADTKEFRETAYGDDSDRARASGDGTNEEQKQRAGELAEEYNSQIDALRDSAISDGVDPSKVPKADALDPSNADSLAADLGKGTIKGLAGGVLSSADTACAGYKYVKVISYGAKAWQARDLIKYAAIFMVTADAAKDGEMTAGKAAVIGTLLTKPSIEKGSKGKTFSDSPGYNLITQGVAKDKAGIARFANGTPDIPFFQGIMNKVESIGGAKTCNFQQSFLGQVLTFGGGLLLSAGQFAGCLATFGGTCASAVASMAIGVTAQYALSAMMHFLEPTLIAMLAGTIAPDPEKDPGGSYAAGNAIASGMGAFGSQIGRGNGLRPIARDEYDSTVLAANRTADYLAQVEAYSDENVRSSAFSKMSENVAIALTPLSLALQSRDPARITASSSTLAASAPSVFQRQFSSILPGASAADHKDYYGGKMCADEDLREQNIATDAFCNPIYAEKEKTLRDHSPEQVIDWMIANGHVDAEGNNSSDEFNTYLSVCIDGTEPIEENSETAICSDTKSPGNDDAIKHRYFRLYVMDGNIVDSIDAAVNDELGVNTEAALTAAGSFTIGSYNILSSAASARHNHALSRQIGGCARNPVPGDPYCGKTRADMQIKIITGQTDATPQIDVMGMQELSPEQYNHFKKNLQGYDVFPDNTSGLSNNDDGAVGVWWNTSKFKKVDQGKFPSISNTSKPIDNPYVGLEDQAGNRIYVTSVHWAVSAFGGGPENIRRSAQKAIDWMKTKKGPETPVFVVGDFNDRITEHHYCVMTQNQGIMMHARDLAAGVNPGNCPRKNNNGTSIDHIYMTPIEGWKVHKWRDPPKTAYPILASSSNHTPVYATISTPGSLDGSTPGSVTMKDDYARECRIGGGQACDGQCVDFVKFRLKKYIDKNKFATLGNGKDVVNTLRSTYGYKTSNTPAVNRVVSWPAGGVPGSGANSTYGHVAMVSKVNSDGSMVIEEYNYASPLKYGTRKISADVARRLSYAHTEVDFR